ncbi:isochorismatase family protein [Cupriavidus sp. 2TAF22]|uniref:isochorismatase family protein n=1 Tax=unclassified Cupriavidus TaxID=2640874 RepID=UPI003F8E0AAD
MLLNAEGSVLVLVDLQARLMPAIHQAERVVRESVRLASIARILGVPVIGTEQSPASLGENLPEIRQLCDRTIAKDHFDACEGGLVEALPAGRKTLVVAGCEAHVCVLQTAMGLLRHGYDVNLVIDASGSRQQASHRAAVERLREAGASAVTVEMVGFEWLRTSRHPRFRDVLALIK